MRRSGQSGALHLVFARAIASLMLVPIVALSVTTAFSSGTGPAARRARIPRMPTAEES